MQGADVTFHILLLLIDLAQIVGTQGPVLLHDACGSLHAACCQFFQQALEGIQCLVLLWFEFPACDPLDGLCIVDNAPRLDADREAYHFAVHRDGIICVLHPLLTA